MSTHNICFHGEIRKMSIILVEKKCHIWQYDDCIKVIRCATSHEKGAYALCKEQKSGSACTVVQSDQYHHCCS